MEAIKLMLVPFLVGAILVPIGLIAGTALTAVFYKWADLGGVILLLLGLLYILKEVARRFVRTLFS